MKNINVECKFNGIAMHGNIPVMECSFINAETEEEICKRYLAPFRAYRMQFSGTESGQGDYGASPVQIWVKMGLNDEQLDSTMRMAVSYAYNEACRYINNLLKIKCEDQNYFFKPIYVNSKELDEFFDLSIKAVKESAKFYC